MANTIVFLAYFYILTHLNVALGIFLSKEMEYGILSCNFQDELRKMSESTKDCLINREKYLIVIILYEDSRRAVTEGVGKMDVLSWDNIYQEINQSEDRVEPRDGAWPMVAGGWEL